MTKARGKAALGAEVNWTAMQVYLRLRLKQAERDQRDGKASPTRREFQKEAAELLGISRASMNRMAVDFNKAYAETGKVNDDAIRATKLRQGNSKPKKRRIPPTVENVMLIRAFVREERKKGKRVTALQILQHLRDVGKVTVEQADGKDDPKGYKAALRAVQRLLQGLGYGRGASRGDGSIELKQHVRDARNEYLERIKEEDAKPVHEQMRRVYTDESYIHQHYRSHHQSLFDPADKQDVQVKLKHKGKRYRFISAIMGPDPRCRVPAKPKDFAQLVKGSTWVTEPPSSKAKKFHTGDCHKNLDDASFSK